MLEEVLKQMVTEMHDLNVNLVAIHRLSAKAADAPTGAGKVAEPQKKSHPPAGTGAAPVTTAEPPAVAATAPTSEVKYDDVKGPFLDLVNQAGGGRDEALKIIALYGAKALPGVPADKLGDVLDRVKAALRGGEQPAASLV